MRMPFAALLSAVALVLVAACGSGGGASPSSPAASTAPSGAPSAASAPPSSGAGAAPTAEGLHGRTFIVSAADGYTVVAGSEIALTFEGEHLAIVAGCNQMSGGYLIEDGVLAVGAMISTEMACEAPLMAQDTWISGFVNGAAITLAGDVLTLARDGITLTATDMTVLHPDLPLEGTTWVVDGLILNQSVSSVPAGVTATLVFAGGSVDVDAGCNTGSGSAEVGETAITFGPVGTTKMACEGPAMEVEAHVLQVLQGDVAYRIDSDTLQLLGAGGGLTLKARP